MNFKLASRFTPTGDQPEAIKFLTESLKAGHPHQTLLGVTGSGKTFTLANIIVNLQRPTLVISHNKTLAAQLYQEFRDFFPQNAVSYFVSYYDYYQPESYLPSTDTYIEKETDINDEIDKLRLSATAHLLTRKDVIIVASVSCIYNLGSPVEYASQNLELVPGQIIDRDVILSRLTDMQYARNDYELKRGTVRVKGDVITLWPADLDYALKISFLDRRIESIKPIDPLTGTPRQPKVEIDPFPHTPHYLIYPAKHYQTNEKYRSQAITAIKSDLKTRLQELKTQGKVLEAYRLAQRVKYDLEMIQEFGFVNGIENYSRYFDSRAPGDPPFTLLDYFQYNVQKFTPGKLSSFLTIIDESHITLPQLRGMYAGDRSRKQTLIDYGFRLPSALDNRPLQFAEISTRLPQVLYSSATPGDLELSLSHPYVAEQLIRPTGLLDPPIEVKPSASQIPDLVKEILTVNQAGGRVLVTTLTKRTAEILTEYLNDPVKINRLIDKFKLHPRPLKLPKVQYLHADVATLDRSDILDDLRTGTFDVLVGINLLREGLDLPEVSLVAILEADKEGFLRSKTSLIQTMGRAARHESGRVIMYADRLTDSMQAAIAEVKRRRQIQLTYNQIHGQKPRGIKKPIRAKLLTREIKVTPKIPLPPLFKDRNWTQLADIDPQSLTPSDKLNLQKTLRALMREAAKSWNFELAAKYRDAAKKIEG